MRSGNRFIEPCSACGKQIERRGIKTDRAAVCAACKTERRKANAEDRRIREAIDWLVVDLVASGESMQGLTTDEVRMVVRRLSDKMLMANESGHDLPPWRWTTTKLAALLHTTPNNIQKIHSRLPKATKRRCPECRCAMWVLESGAIEEHGNGFLETCPISGMMKGLAAIRPDLYQWATSA